MGYWKNIIMPIPCSECHRRGWSGQASPLGSQKTNKTTHSRAWQIKFFLYIIPYSINRTCIIGHILQQFLYFVPFTTIKKIFTCHMFITVLIASVTYLGKVMLLRMSSLCISEQNHYVYIKRKKTYQEKSYRQL